MDPRTVGMESCEEQLREQRYAVKFCFWQGKTHLQTLDTLPTTYGDAEMSRATIYHWYEAFERGRESVALKGGPLSIHINNRETNCIPFTIAGWYHHRLMILKSENFSYR